MENLMTDGVKRAISITTPIFLLISQAIDEMYSHEIVPSYLEANTTTRI